MPKSRVAVFLTHNVVVVNTSCIDHCGWFVRSVKHNDACVRACMSGYNVRSRHSDLVRPFAALSLASTHVLNNDSGPASLVSVCLSVCHDWLQEQTTRRLSIVSFIQTEHIIALTS